MQAERNTKTSSHAFGVRLLGVAGLAVVCWQLAMAPGLAQTPSPSASPTPSPSPTNAGGGQAEPSPTPSPEPSPTPEPSPSAERSPAATSTRPKVTAAATAAVSATDNVFVPKSVAVAAGETVTWSNDGEFVHTMTSDAGLFDSGPVAAGGSFSFTFREPGTYPYYCQIHGGPGGAGMAGAIVVAGAPEQQGGEGDGVAPAQQPLPGNLPNTGAGLGWAIAGAAAIAAGSVLLLIARR